MADFQFKPRAPININVELDTNGFIVPTDSSTTPAKSKSVLIPMAAYQNSTEFISSAQAQQIFDVFQEIFQFKYNLIDSSQRLYRKWVV